MKSPLLALIAFVLSFSATRLSLGEVAEPSKHQFNYEKYTAESGTLYRSSGSQTNDDAHVTALFVDSTGRLWVGTHTGVAICASNQWQSRTFEVKGLPPRLRAAFDLMQISGCGPNHFAEGPPGTVWLAGRCGVWRFRDNQYEEIASNSIGHILGIAVENSGRGWIVTREVAQMFDGTNWNAMLRPYFANSVHRELSCLRGIAIGTNGSVWIGGTVYGELEGPWEHEGPTWLIDQERKRRDEGPPMAPLFEYDGKRWRAFGPPHGLNAKWASPMMDAEGNVSAGTGNGYYYADGEKWRPAGKKAVLFSGKQWTLREFKTGLWRVVPQLLFRVGERSVDVQASDHRTGEILNLQSKELGRLRIAEDPKRNCLWLGTHHGLYRIWAESQGSTNP